MLANKALPKLTKNSILQNNNKIRPIATRPCPTTQATVPQIIVGVVFYNPTQYMYSEYKRLRAFPASVYEICKHFRHVRILKFLNKYEFALYAKRRKKYDMETPCYLVEIRVVNIEHTGFLSLFPAVITVDITVYSREMQILYQKEVAGIFDKVEPKLPICKTRKKHSAYGFGAHSCPCRPRHPILPKGYGGQKEPIPSYRPHRNKPMRFQNIYAALMLAMYKITGDKYSLWNFDTKFKDAVKIAQREYKTITPIDIHSQKKQATTKPNIRKTKAKAKKGKALPFPEKIK